jgi:hypothetical protein
MKDVGVLIGVVIFSSIPIWMSLLYVRWLKTGRVLAEEQKEKEV